MSKKKPFTNQHIVPVSYLRRFATKGNSAYRIGVICADKHFIDSIDNVGYIKHYYDIEGEDSKKWEHYYGKEIEPLYGKPLDGIIAGVTLSPNRQVILDENKKKLLSKLLISQWLRVPDFLDVKIRQMPSMFRQIKKEFLAQNKGKVSKEIEHKIKVFDYPSSKRKDLILSTINAEDRLSMYVDVLSSKLWIMYYNPYYTKVPFITSDNPVVAINIDSKSINRKDNGINNNKTVIFFPLSPSVAVAIYPTPIKNLAPQIDGGKRILSETNHKLILNINTRIAEQRYKEVFVPLYIYEQLFKEIR